VWVDEAGFYLLAGVVRSYAPRGHTPILRVPLTKDHLSVIGGITRHGHLLTQMQDHAFDSAGVVCFLRHLRGHLGDRLLIIWDGAPIHREGAVKTFLTSEAGRQMQVEQLPGYAPDLNPSEGVWDHLKNVELRNVTCHTPQDLRQQVRRAVARLRQKPHLICSFIKHYGY
jgi:transposase